MKELGTLKVEMSNPTLTVGELIKALRLSDPKLPVFVSDARDGDNTRPLTRVLAAAADGGVVHAVVLL